MQTTLDITQENIQKNQEYFHPTQQEDYKEKTSNSILKKTITLTNLEQYDFVFSLNFY